MARELQHVLMPNEIAARIGARVDEAVPYTGLGCQMQDDIVRLISGRLRRALRRRRYPHSANRKPRRSTDLPEACFLQCRIIIGIEVIERRNLMPARKQRRRGMEADESRAARQQNSHRNIRVQIRGRWRG